MAQLTVKELYTELHKEIQKGNGDKLLVTADDVEGNGYHGIFFGVTPGEELDLEYTDIYDSETDDTTKLICIG